jgi:ribonucleoside-diphosphate reductase alpha chain
MFIDAFQEKIWRDKYQYKDETYEGFCKRLSSNIFKDEPKYRKELYDYLKAFEVLFGGRINANIGINEQGLTLFNCYIISTSSYDMDSLEGILSFAKEFALTLKSEGGIGFCANFLRPSRTLIRKIGVTTPGAVKFLEIFDKVSEVITSGGVSKTNSYQGVPTKNSIRKGATMVTMSVCHPDIEDFIIAKSVPNRLTKMNMSVLITDAFMYAVKNDLDWDLWYPDINFEKYKEEWDGSFEKWAEKNYPTVVYKTLKARDLWEAVLEQTWKRNEPGIIFVDLMRKYNNLHYLENCEINATNPCSEVFGATGKITYKNEELLIGDVCNLGSVNIVKFYDLETKKFDFAGFNKRVSIMARALDNIIELSNYPVKQYELSAKLRRKIGVGLTGIGSLFMMMNIKYGGKESVEFSNELLSNFMNTLYKTSALMAKEKGPFELYSEKLLDAGYTSLGILDTEVIDLIKKYGLRNCALSALAPTGTLSILAGNVSSGIEPVFSKEFLRWNRVEGKSVDFKYPKVHKGEWFETDYFVENTVNGEVVLESNDGKYRIDKNTGLCEKIKIKDYGYSVAEKMGFSETMGATELTIQEHLDILSIFNKYIDIAISKTVNLPNDLDLKSFIGLYGKLYEYGVKGCTTYREGTMVGILETEKKKKEKSIRAQQKEFLNAFKEQENGDVIVGDVKLPEEYPAKGYILRGEGRKWYIHLAFKDKACKRPFAIFVNTNNREDNVLTFNALEKLEEIARFKGLKEEFIEETKRKYAYQKNPVKICRMLGLVLRHNIDILTIIKGLGELEATVGTFVFHITKFLSKFVDAHDVEGMSCPECGGKSIVFKEGCFQCSDCQYSRCG